MEGEGQSPDTALLGEGRLRFHQPPEERSN